MVPVSPAVLPNGGGAVYLSGEMAINGGEISNNTAVGDIYEINDVDRSARRTRRRNYDRACRADYATSYDAPAKLTMRGGTVISGNAATSDVSAFGGAISIIGTPDTGNLTNTFVIWRYDLSNNKAVYNEWLVRQMMRYSERLYCGNAIEQRAVSFIWTEHR